MSGILESFPMHKIYFFLKERNLVINQHNVTIKVEIKATSNKEKTPTTGKNNYRLLTKAERLPMKLRLHYSRPVDHY